MLCMRRLWLVLLSAVALPLAAWELPTQSELAAVRGEEPFASALAAGIPLPPSREEAQAAAGWRFGLQRQAIKRALVYQKVRAKAERHRVSRDNYRSTAAYARKCGAPDIIVRYLELLTDDSLTRRQEYVVARALQHVLLEVYGVDELQIRLVTEYADLPASELLPFMLQMPVHGMYDVAPKELPPRETLVADVLLMAGVLGQVDAALSRVTDRESADAAAAELQNLLPLWNTTLAVRVHMPEAKLEYTVAERMAMQLLETKVNQLQKTRQALFAKDWFSSVRLRVLNTLLCL